MPLPKPKQIVWVTGVQRVKRNLAAYSAGKATAFERGLRKAGLLLFGVSSKKYCPKQTGALRGSGFIRTFGSGWNTDVVVGYTAKYAVYVHEDPTKAHGRAFNIKHAAEIAHAKANNLWAATAEGGMFERGEDQQYKYLEKPARILRPQMLAIIAAEGKK